jgi:hypothetical protein
MFTHITSLTIIPNDKLGRFVNPVYITVRSATILSACLKITKKSETPTIYFLVRDLRRPRATQPDRDQPFRPASQYQDKL